MKFPAGGRRFFSSKTKRMCDRGLAGGLRKYGYHVFEAADGQAAWDLYESEPSRVDLILLDLSMPILSGESFLRSLRSVDSTLPIVLSTGSLRMI